jgi:hypothetical protein
MAKIRFGYSDDFTAKNSGVGINTTDPQTNLDVVGVIKGQDLKVTGISSQTGYEGFLRADHQIEENTQLNFGQGINASLSGEIIVGTGQTVTINEVAKETVAVGNNGNKLWHNLVAGKHSGIINGAYWNGSTFDFDGSDDVITGESCLTLFTDDTDHTIEMWVKFDDVTTRRTIISGYDSNTSTYADRWDIEVSGGKIQGGHHGAGYWTSTASVVTGVWYHLVFVHDHASSLWRLFINTSTDVTGSNGGLDLTSDALLGIGDRTESSIGHLDGQISIVRIYSRELTSTEISTNYNLGPFSKETSVTSNLITHYNASNPSSYPGTFSAVDTTDTTIAGGSQVECMKVYNTFTPPSGDTNQRPSKPKPGQLYYNYDFKTIEFFDGYGWRQVDNTTRSGRGVFMAGFDPGFDLSISYINISSRGNTQNFGEVTPNMGGGCAGLGNATRGLVAGGFAPSYHDVIEYITIAAGGNSIDFGNLTDARRYASGASSSTRGVFAGGYSPGVVNVIDYVEITTIGNALDFGDLSEQGEALGTATSPTRACFAGGRHPQTDEFIDYITMASTGDAIDFGDLSQARQNMCYHTSSSSTRGIFGGGIIPAQVNTIDYITIAATGNAIDFGDLTVKRRLGFNVSTQTRAVFAGGYNNVTSMDYVTIATAGDAIDFGEITSGQLFSGGACSDSHGGLGGF